VPQCPVRATGHAPPPLHTSQAVAPSTEIKFVPPSPSDGGSEPAAARTDNCGAPDDAGNARPRFGRTWERRLLK
jgi:hypothetical protein